MAKPSSIATDMTEGSALKLLVAFSLPLMAGSYLQETYNAVDAIIVGRFVGRGALAAVGMSLPIANFIIGIFMGLSTGCCVSVSRRYGAKDIEGLSKAIHTSLLMALLLGVALQILGVSLAPWLLRTIHTPQAIFVEASVYYRIYFAALPALTVYNMGASILNALGNSRKPLEFLCISAAINILLDLLFVCILSMGVAGVALATAIAQAVSATLALRALSNPGLPCAFAFKKLAIDPEALREALIVGVPISARNFINGISTLLLQSYINGLGDAAVAGWGVTAKIDAYIYTMANAVSLGLTAFVGQNLGAGNAKRARLGVGTALLLAVGVSFANTVALLMLNVRALRIFTSDPEVLACALTFMKVLTTSYFIMSVPTILQSALAAGGSPIAPNAVNILTHVVLRQIYLYIVSRTHYTPAFVAFSYPGAWIIAAILLGALYLRSDWTRFERARSERGHNGLALSAEP